MERRRTKDQTLLGALQGPVLALGPHTDDVEFGAGGLISSLTRRGTEVHCVDFCNARESLPPGFPEDVLLTEAVDAMSRLGVRPASVRVLDFPVRRFPEFRQQILDAIITLRTEVDPVLVLVPASTDVHQDHQVIHQEAIRAFKARNIIGYELPWNCITFHSHLFVDLRADDIERKLAAIAAYKSQTHRSYADPDFVRGWARMRGITSGATHAEAFEVVRLVERDLS